MHLARALLAAQLIVVSASAQAGEPAAAVLSPPAATRLTITVITSDDGVPTLQERVSSWFRDGTQVSVAVASELPSERIFTAGPHEVRVWVVRLSSERAVVMFSTAPGPESARYLLREVRLVSGLDELGLERLASVIHAAFVALREGIEGFERPQVERELVEAGLLQGAPPPPAAPATLTESTEPPARDFVMAPIPADSRDHGAARAASRVLLAVGYGTRLRGAEQLGHGPLLQAGFETRSSLGVLEALLSAHLLLGSDFDAGAFAASVQTSAFRAHVGVAPSLSRRVHLQALLGAGADWAHISSEVRAPSPGSQVQSREPGSQWRGALEFTLGLWWKSRLVDWGATAHGTFLYGDVHYSLESAGVARRLVTPWPVQPGLSLQARFRSTP